MSMEQWSASDEKSGAMDSHNQPVPTGALSRENLQENSLGYAQAQSPSETENNSQRLTVDKVRQFIATATVQEIDEVFEFNSSELDAAAARALQRVQAEIQAMRTSSEPLNTSGSDEQKLYNSDAPAL